MVGSHLLSHLFLMPIAERAFHDAGYQLDGHKRNIAVIVAGDVDYSCSRYQARNEMAWQVRDSLAHSGISLSEAQTAALETIVRTACSRNRIRKASPAASAMWWPAASPPT